MIKKFHRLAALLGFLFLLHLATPLHAQDIFKRTATPYVQFGGPGQPQVPWGSGAGAFNNNFWFNALFPEDGICVWITNNNPSNSHAFTLAVQSTGNPSVPGFTGFTGQWVVTGDAGGTTFPFTLPAVSTKSFFFAARSSAFIALQFSGSSTAAGSPDTATITAVETNAANCSAVVLGNTVIGPTPAGSLVAVSNRNPVIVGGLQNVSGNENNTAMFADVDSTTKGWVVGTTGSWNEATASFATGQLNNSNNGAPQMFASLTMGSQADTAPGGGSGSTYAMARASKAYSLATSSIWAWGATQEAGATQNPLLSFQAQKDAVNPAAGALLLSVNISNATNPGFTPYRITVSCSAACDYTINRVTDAGTTCTAVTPVKAFDPGISGSNLIVGASTGTCVANPTISQTLYHIWLQAGGTNVIDMTGYSWARSTTVGKGFDVQLGTALTGTASTTIEFMQRGVNQ